MDRRPRLLTFDIFGTVLDWQRGLTESLAALGVVLGPGDFDRVIDAQGAAEQAGYRPYAEIVADSIRPLGVPDQEAMAIGRGAGRWPLFADAPEGLRRLLRLAPCAATTNSDRGHGEEVQAQLGFRLSHWICAEDLHRYKPDPEVWRATARRLGTPLDRGWWHVSAYADYDLDVARRLGLTTVLVRRRHCRPGPADLAVADLGELADSIERIDR
jgi:2-haloalkanoic acid dehalogenase type II